MSTEVAAAIIATAVMVVLLAGGIPIAIGLGIAGCTGIFLIGGETGLLMAPHSIFAHLNNWVLVAIPLFVFAGQVIVSIGVGAQLFTAGQRWLGRFPGGLGLGTIGAATVFAACSGSVTASTAGIGRVAVPEMINQGYSPRLACGCMGGAGGIATVIPPSIGFIVYGWLSGMSVGKLFIAGIIPGLLLAITESIVVISWAKLKPGSAGAVQNFSWRERWRSLLPIWPVAIIVFSVLGTIYLGICTPTEAGGIAAIAALFLGWAYYRKINWQTLKTSFMEAARVTGQLAIIITGAMIFGHFLALSRVSVEICQWVGSLPLPPIGIAVIMTAMLFILGCFMDVLAIQLIFLPLLIAIAQQFGLDLIWFGVISVVAMEVAAITPPFGLNLFILKTLIPEVSYGDIIMGNLPFVLSDTFTLALVVTFPWLSLVLPSLMSV